MTSETPKVEPTGRYTAAAACRALGICYNTLRRYEALGFIRPTFGKERRVFLGSEILRCWRTV